MIHVPQVQSDTFYPRQTVAPVNPRPASHSGFEVKPPHVLLRTVCGLARNPRARTDNTHVALQHIDKLWYLIERPQAQQPSYASYARIVLHNGQTASAVLRIHDHGAELVTTKCFTIYTNSLLDE